MRRRLDVELVRRGLVPSRGRAVEAIDAGRVLVGGAPARPPPARSTAGKPIALLAAEGPDYVSRGGHKLAAALDAFAVDVHGRGARSTSAPRPAASPTACCSAAPRTCSRSTSVGASSRGRCARTTA